MELHPSTLIILKGKNKGYFFKSSVMNFRTSCRNKYCLQSFQFIGPTKRKVVKVNRAMTYTATQLQKS